MTGLAVLPCGTFCDGCRWWMPNHPDRCGHRLWKEFTALERLPKRCPIGIILAGETDQTPSPFFNIATDQWPNPVRNALGVSPMQLEQDAFRNAFHVDPLTGSAWGKRVFTSRLVPGDDGHYRAEETEPQTVAEQSAKEFRAALQKLIGDESEALDALEKLSRTRRKVRERIQELLDEPDPGPFSSWEDGRKDAFREVLKLIDGELEKLTK